MQCRIGVTIAGSYLIAKSTHSPFYCIGLFPAFDPGRRTTADDAGIDNRSVCRVQGLWSLRYMLQMQRQYSLPKCLPPTAKRIVQLLLCGSNSHRIRNPAPCRGIGNFVRSNLRNLRRMRGNIFSAPPENINPSWL